MYAICSRLRVIIGGFCCCEFRSLRYLVRDTICATGYSDTPCTSAWFDLTFLSSLQNRSMEQVHLLTVPTDIRHSDESLTMRPCSSSRMILVSFPLVLVTRENEILSLTFPEFSISNSLNRNFSFLPGDQSRHSKTNRRSP